VIRLDMGRREERKLDTSQAMDWVTVARKVDMVARRVVMVVFMMMRVVMMTTTTMMMPIVIML